MQNLQRNLGPIKVGRNLSQLLEDLETEAQAWRDAQPRDDEGRIRCATCSAICEETDAECTACRREETRRLELREARYRLAAWWRDATRPEPPAWPWARFDDAKFRRLANARVLAAAEAWARAGGRSGLVLLGPTGSGKTASLVGALHQLHADKRAELERLDVEALRRWRPAPDVVWTSGPVLLEERRRERLGGPAPAIASRARSAGIVVLDELGYVDMPELLLDIADARYARGLPTVVTSGARAPDLIARIGAAVWRKLTAGAEIVDVHPARASAG